MKANRNRIRIAVAPLSKILLLFFAVVILLGAPLPGLILFGGFLFYRSRTSGPDPLYRFLDWVERNRLILVLAVGLSLLSTLVLVSATEQVRVYGFPLSFVIYYPRHVSAEAASIPNLSEFAFRAGQFLLNIACYYILLSVLMRMKRRFIQPA